MGKPNAFDDLFSSRMNRRSFGELGLSALAASALSSAVPVVGEAKPALYQSSPGNVVATEFFGLDKRLDRAQTRRIYTPGILAAAPTPVQHMLFFYDQAKGLVNPFNIAPDSVFVAGKKYSFQAEILNFHTSQPKDNEVWKNLQDDLQLQLSVSSRNNDDEFTWIALSALRVFLGGKKSGTDQRLQQFKEGLMPTKDFTGTSQIAIENGLGSLQLQVFAQKKASFWSQLLQIGAAAADAFAFGVLPIPKLLSQGVKFTTQVLDHIQSQNRLVPILTSAQIPFRLRTDVKEADATFRPGLWVAIERQFALASIDKNTDLPDFKVDVPGQFYEVNDRTRKPIPADYVVCRFRFPEIKS